MPNNLPTLLATRLKSTLHQTHGTSDNPSPCFTQSKTDLSASSVQRVAAGITCHGTDPRKKYIKTYPKDSMSSLRDCSMPRCVLMDAYRAVPVKFLFSLYGMWMWVLGSRYFFASPKSMMLTWFARLPKPMRKLSGLISRWMKLFVWTYSIRDICKHTKHRQEFPAKCTEFPMLIASRVWEPTNWSASIRTVFRLNFRLQKLKRSSRLGPNKSRTMTL